MSWCDQILLGTEMKCRFRSYSKPSISRLTESYVSAPELSSALPQRRP
jgi:hypothetical protein